MRTCTPAWALVRRMEAKGRRALRRLPVAPQDLAANSFQKPAKSWPRHPMSEGGSGPDQKTSGMDDRASGQSVQRSASSGTTRRSSAVPPRLFAARRGRLPGPRPAATAPALPRSLRRRRGSLHRHPREPPREAVWGPDAASCRTRPAAGAGGRVRGGIRPCTRGRSGPALPAGAAFGGGHCAVANCRSARALRPCGGGRGGENGRLAAADPAAMPHNSGRDQPL